MSNKKNLLIYAHYYIPDTASTGQILRELAEGMLDKFNITVICVVPSYLGTIEEKYKTQKYYKEEINGVKVLRIRVPEFSKTNKKSRVKNIVSYFFGSMGATFKVGKMDYVFSISQPPILGGIDWQREKWQSGLGSKFIHQGEKNAAKYADEVIVLSKGVQDYFKETYGRETHFIPNGVNRPQIREASLITDKFGLKKDSYILFLGRLVPEKGIRYLVEAFKNVKTDKKLVIAGGSSDTDSFMEELKELAKGDDRILFTGFVQGAMLDELYSNAYIYTLPSDLEGMPLSLLEAMSYGNCCLVSDIPECAEVVEDKALIFKKSDVEDLREKLQEACDHPEMVMKMKNQAADFICEKYNWDEVVRETMKLYTRK